MDWHQKYKEGFEIKVPAFISSVDRDDARLPYKITVTLSNCDLDHLSVWISEEEMDVLVAGSGVDGKKKVLQLSKEKLQKQLEEVEEQIKQIEEK